MKPVKLRGRDLKWNRTWKGRRELRGERTGGGRWKGGKEIKLRHENEIIKS